MLQGISCIQHAEHITAQPLQCKVTLKFDIDSDSGTLQMHQRMKADTEWAAIEAKIAGADTDWKVAHVF